MRRLVLGAGALGLALVAAASPGALANEGTMADAVLAQGNRAASPTPGRSPGAPEPDGPGAPERGASGLRERDAASGADEVGIGRSTGGVRSSGDEGGTAAGMPGGGPESGR
jgi:hypothetical protein